MAGTKTRLCTHVVLYLLLLLHAVPCIGQTVSENPPRVLFMEHLENAPSDAALFTAIRAQLSVSSLFIERVQGVSDLNASAPRLANEHRAALVFWIEDEDPCQIHFFVPDDKGGQFSVRTIEIESNNPTSRYEVIAVVVAVMIEGLIAKSPPLLPPKPPPQPSGGKSPKPNETPRRFEFTSAYKGSLTAAETMSHGGTLGFGVMPPGRLFVGISFSLFAPSTFSNDALRIQLISRQLEADAAVRWLPSPFEIRLGVSYCADFRSYATTALQDTIRPREDGYNVVHAFVPFLLTAWTYRERIGIFGKVGASLGINETVFRIHRTNDAFSEELEPFDVKLIFQFGLLVLL